MPEDKLNILENNLDNLSITRGQFKLQEQLIAENCDKFISSFLQLDNDEESQAKLKQLILFVSSIMQEVLGTGITCNKYIFDAYTWSRTNHFVGIKLPYRPLLTLQEVKVYAKTENKMIVLPNNYFNVWSQQSAIIFLPNITVPVMDSNNVKNISIKIDLGYNHIDDVPKDILNIGLIIIRDLYSENQKMQITRNNFYIQNITNRIRRLASHRIKYRI